MCNTNFLNALFCTCVYGLQKHECFMDITVAYKPDREYIYYVQKLSRGVWKTVSWSFDLNSAWECTRYRYSYERERYRLLKVDISVITNYG